MTSLVRDIANYIWRRTWPASPDAMPAPVGNDDTNIPAEIDELWGNPPRALVTAAFALVGERSRQIGLMAERGSPLTAEDLIEVLPADWEAAEAALRERGPSGG